MRFCGPKAIGEPAMKYFADASTPISSPRLIAMHPAKALARANRVAGVHVIVSVFVVR